MFEVMTVNQTKEAGANDAARAAQVAGVLLIVAGCAVALWGAPLSGATIVALLVQLAGGWVAGPLAHGMVARSVAPANRVPLRAPRPRLAPAGVDFVWADAA